VSVFHRFHPRLREAIVRNLGWRSLRAVQEETGELVLGGGNGIVLAPTAGGKTEAAFFPLLSLLLADEPPGLGVIYIAPIKALLNNQAERLAVYTRMVGLDRFVWHGDVPNSARRRFLAEPRTVLMTTPESLEVLLMSARVDEQTLFADLRAIVVDEIHALGGTDRGAHLMSVLERLTALSSHDVQRLGLSATVGNPEAMRGWLQGTSKRPSRVINPRHPPAKRELLVIYRADEERIARDASRLVRGVKSLAFCGSRSTTESVAQTMRRSGTDVYVHHSSVSKDERAEAEERFSRGRDACIVCTSTLELGIDVGDLDKVLQIDAPDTVGSFLQRMGRTGRRAGTTANTTFLCETPDAVLQSIALVALARSGWVESVRVRDRCWPVLVHQLLTLSLSQAGVIKEQAWEHFQRVPDFSGISRAEFDRLIDWMLRDGSLDHASGRLVLGPKAERLYGRRNFMEIYAVFESPVSYTVILKPSNRPLGSLGQSFVDRLSVRGSFVLSGRSWRVLDIAHKGRQISVEPAPVGRRPTWGGHTPQFLSFTLCQQIRNLLLDDQEPSFLHASAQRVLEAARADFEGLLERDSRRDIIEQGGEWIWWTFAGGQINQTIRAALQAAGGEWKVVADNLAVKVRGCTDRSRLMAAIAAISETEFWENDAMWREISEGLPSYRLSKFQPVLPKWIEQEMLADFLLDIEGAWHWVCGRPSDERLLVGTTPPPTLVEEPADSIYTPKRPIHWISDALALVQLCDSLASQAVIALDVETTLRNRQLCLVQLGTAEANYLIDPLAISDLSPLARLMANENVAKVIHNASFEKSVLGKQGMEIITIIDTLKLSRQKHGYKTPGGHSLGAVCDREMGIALDKTEQVSDWRRRPLTNSQRDYAAIDVEVLIDLYARLGGDRQGRLL